jgi:hypothetical protein
VVVIPWGSEITPKNREEARLLGPLLNYLMRTRRLRPSTVVKLEFPWNGRRVDLATLSSSGLTSAYELKLSSTQRAIEQAGYNRLAFDRSWVVTEGRTNERSLEQARLLGVGVLSLVDGELSLLHAASLQPRVNRVIRARLLRSLRAGGSSSV